MGINWFQVTVTAAIVTFLAAGAHNLRVDYLEKQHAKALTAQETKLNKECAESKMGSYEVSNVYQKNLLGIDGQYDSLVLRSNNAAVPISISDAGGGCDAGRPASAVVPKSNGVSAQKLFELARDADKERALRRACQVTFSKHLELEGVVLPK